MDSLFRELKIYAVAGPEVRAGRPRPAAQLLRVADGPDPRGGHHRGRLDGQLHRRRHGVRHPRRADGAVLHVLFDVRFPARRRPHLAGRRRTHARLPARRHRRTHHAARRGPAAPGRPLARARQHGAAVQAYDPAFAYEVGGDRAGRACSGCTATPAATTPTSSTTSRSTTRTTRCRRCPSDARARRRIMRGLYRWSPASRGHATAGDDPVLRLGARGRTRGRRRARRALRRRRRAVVGHVVQGAARGGAGGRALEPPAPAARRPRSPIVDAAARWRRRVRSSRSPTS